MRYWNEIVKRFVLIIICQFNLSNSCQQVVKNICCNHYDIHIGKIHSKFPTFEITRQIQNTCSLLTVKNLIIAYCNIELDYQQLTETFSANYQFGITKWMSKYKSTEI